MNPVDAKFRMVTRVMSYVKSKKYNITSDEYKRVATELCKLDSLTISYLHKMLKERNLCQKV